MAIDVERVISDKAEETRKTFRASLDETTSTLVQKMLRRYQSC